MGLVDDFHALWAHIRALRESVASLLVTVSEDRPQEGDVALVDLLADQLVELIATLDEAMSSTEGGLLVGSRASDRNAVVQALEGCQRATGHFQQRFAEDVAHFRRLSEIAKLGRERGGEWETWARCVLEGVDSCRAPAAQVAHTLAQCWRATVLEFTGTPNASRTPALAPE